MSVSTPETHIGPPIVPSLVGIHELPVEILVDIFAWVDTVNAWGTLGAVYGRGVAKAHARLSPLARRCSRNPRVLALR